MTKRTEWSTWALDKLLVPVVTALLVIGGAWVTLGDVKADVAEIRAEHNGPASHALLNARVNILEESAAIQGKNVIAICHATDAECEF